MPHRFATISLAALCITLMLTGCVRRELRITSDPPGALVWLDGEEVGRTPLATPLDWYGKHDVILSRDGHQTLRTQRWLVAPWWQWVPFDLAAELMPWGPTDVKTLSFTLTLEPKDAAQGLLDRAVQQRAEFAPATQPASITASEGP